jgi:hypothetical protein
MTSRTSHQHRPVSDSGETLAALNDSILEGMDQTREALVDRITAFQRETLDFVNRRLEQDADFVRQYRQCRTMADILAAQQKWLAHLGEDYLREFVKLAQVMQTTAPAADENAEHVRPSHGRPGESRREGAAA